MDPSPPASPTFASLPHQYSLSPTTLDALVLKEDTNDIPSPLQEDTLDDLEVDDGFEGLELPPIVIPISHIEDQAVASPSESTDGPLDVKTLHITFKPATNRGPAPTFRKTLSQPTTPIQSPLEPGNTSDIKDEDLPPPPIAKDTLPKSFSSAKYTASGIPLNSDGFFGKAIPRAPSGPPPPGQPPNGLTGMEVKPKPPPDVEPDKAPQQQPCQQSQTDETSLEPGPDANDSKSPNVNIRAEAAGSAEEASVSLQTSPSIPTPPNRNSSYQVLKSRPIADSPQQTAGSLKAESLTDGQEENLTELSETQKETPANTTNLNVRKPTYHGMVTSGPGLMQPYRYNPVVRATFTVEPRANATLGGTVMDLDQKQETEVQTGYSSAESSVSYSGVNSGASYASATNPHYSASTKVSNRPGMPMNTAYHNQYSGASYTSGAPGNYSNQGPPGAAYNRPTQYSASPAQWQGAHFGYQNHVQIPPPASSEWQQSPQSVGNRQAPPPPPGPPPGPPPPQGMAPPFPQANQPTPPFALNNSIPSQPTAPPPQGFDGNWQGMSSQPGYGPPFPILPNQAPPPPTPGMPPPPGIHIAPPPPSGIPQFNAPAAMSPPYHNAPPPNSLEQPAFGSPYPAPPQPLRAQELQPGTQSGSASDYQNDAHMTRRPTFRRNIGKQSINRRDVMDRNLDKLRADFANASGSAKSTAAFALAKYSIESVCESVNPDESEKLREDGFKILVKLSRSGMPEAQYYLGKAFAEDNRYDLAYPQFVRSAKAGYAPAQYALGSCLENGRGCKRDTKTALGCYRKASFSGHKLAMYRYGIGLVNGDLGTAPNPIEGIKWLKKCAALADKEHPHALLQLAIIYETGIPPLVSQDQSNARSYLDEAVRLEYGPAIYRMALMYETGKLSNQPDSAPNLQKALELYQRGANLKDPDCQYALSDFYLKGIPGLLTENHEQALYWADMAAGKGHADSQYAMGYFFEHGIGTLPNIDSARDWYKKAAKNGSQRAITWFANNPQLQMEFESGKKRAQRDDNKCLIS
ncbi:hypothetical protein HDU97_006384 [Phlyctochytrium planicorne]|nr:hypothetical protein HDU97_006384 [Phlyctochytrium planicorne]